MQDNTRIIAILNATINLVRWENRDNHEVSISEVETALDPLRAAISTHNDGELNETIQGLGQIISGIDLGGYLAGDTRINAVDRYGVTTQSANSWSQISVDDLLDALHEITSRVIY